MVNKIDGNNYYDYQKLKNVNIPSTGEKFSLDYKQNELRQDAEKTKTDKASDKQDKTDEKGGVKLELSGKGQEAASGGGRSVYKSRPQETTEAQSLIDTVRKFISTAIAAVKEFFYKIWNDPQPQDAEGQNTENDAAFAETLDLAKAADSAEALEPAETADLAKKTDSANTAVLAGMKDSAQLDATNSIGEDFQAELAGLDARNAYRISNERLNRKIQPYLRSGDLNRVMSLLTDDGRKTIAKNSSLLTYYDKNGRMVEPSASDRERILHGDGNTRKL